jgi:hypothetical protein
MRDAPALSTDGTVDADNRARECNNPVCVKVSGPGALPEHVVAATLFDDIRRRPPRPANALLVPSRLKS